MRDLPVWISPFTSPGFSACLVVLDDVRLLAKAGQALARLPRRRPRTGTPFECRESVRPQRGNPSNWFESKHILGLARILKSFCRSCAFFPRGGVADCFLLLRKMCDVLISGTEGHIIDLFVGPDWAKALGLGPAAMAFAWACVYPRLRNSPSTSRG